jgi:hypothetical protein
MADDTGMACELWDLETRNLVETSRSETEALQAARELIALNVPAYPESLALVSEDDGGVPTFIARGPGLAARANLVR